MPSWLPDPDLRRLLLDPEAWRLLGSLLADGELPLRTSPDPSFRRGSGPPPLLLVPAWP